MLVNAGQAYSDNPIDVYALFQRDNTVIPLSFWSLDDKEIQIDNILGQQNAATFKTKGIGERYKIRARNVVSYLFRIGDQWYMGLPSDDMRIPGIHTKYTGEYYGDKIIIDARYDNPYKFSVDVAAVCYAIGDVIPIAFSINNGRVLEIDQVMNWERAASLTAGIMGMRYSIRVRDKETYLYRDDDLWFMENKKIAHTHVLDVHGRPVE